jgi:hypothetical protein
MVHYFRLTKLKTWQNNFTFFEDSEEKTFFSEKCQQVLRLKLRLNLAS